MNKNPVSYQNQIKEKERLCVCCRGNFFSVLEAGVEFNGLGFVDVDPELGGRTFDTKWAQRVLHFYYIFYPLVGTWVNE